MLGLSGRLAGCVFAGLVCGLLVMPVLAIQPVTVQHETESDFADGATEGTRVTNTGKVALARLVEDLAEGGESFTTVFDVLGVGEAFRIAAGPNGYYTVIAGEEPVAIEGVAENEQVFALARTSESVVVAISSQELSRLAVEVKDEAGKVSLETIAELEGVRYVWQVIPVSQGVFAVATGTEGKVLLVREGADPEVLLETGQGNVLSLALSADGESLFAGTDGEGLVYRIRFQGDEPEVAVVFDAGEPEIASLLALEDGSLLVGTADADEAGPGRLGDLVEEPSGEVEPAAEEASSEEPAEAEGEVAEAEMTEVAEEEAAESDEVIEVEEEVAVVTDEQRDRLREALRERLLEARERGSMKTSGLASKRGSGKKRSSGSPSRPTAAATPTEDGNAVYRITPDGFVEVLLRESVTMLRLVKQDDLVLVGTGNEGQVYTVDPATLEISVLADFESEQVSFLAVGDEGDLLAGLSNPAMLVRLSGAPELRGTYESMVIDAGQISLWGTGRLRVLLPEGASVTFETRSGNVGDPDSGFWSEWSAPLGLMPLEAVPAAVPREVTITSPPARFLQYRLTLLGDGKALPEVDAVELTHVMPNLAPKITAASIEVPEVSGPDEEVEAVYNVSWEAVDPNGDRLEYTVEMQPAGSSVWLKGAEDLTETEYSWAVNRVPDGWYRVRVTASDLLDNPSDMARKAKRVTEPVLVDRTSPEIEDLAWVALGEGRVRVSGVAVDALAPIIGIGYAVDGAEAYRPIVPEDLILDSTQEAFSVTLRGFTGPEHVLTLRVVDRRGNVRLIPLIIKMNPAAD